MIRTPIAITMAIITTVTAVMSTAMSIIVQETLCGCDEGTEEE
jgi:hypothetical protein